MGSWMRQRERMVRRQIAARGIRDERLLEAFREVPRESFVPPDVQRSAYEDGPLPIGEGQTISQPFVVALMTDLLELTPESRVLEIGAGSGYAAAIMGRIAARVIAIERSASLAREARERLAALSYDNVEVICADGTYGWAEQAPYDAIVAAAAAARVPEALRRQLRVGGRLVLPVGPPEGPQFLVRITRAEEERFEEEQLDPVRFVPLVPDAPN